MAASMEMKPTKLFIGGISQNTTTKDLRAHFGQYGRVLDCVAMRRDDGRSRSFGYVTLDSPEAADKCVVEAQIIDGRVVDVKRAVPERAARDKSAFDSEEGKGKLRSPKSSSPKKDENWRVLEASPKKSEWINLDAPEFTPMTQSTAASFEDFEFLSPESSDAATSPLEAAAALLNIKAPPGLSAPPGLATPPGLSLEALPLTGLPAGIPPPPPVPPPPRPEENAAEKTSDMDNANDEVSTAPPSQSTTPETVMVDLADDSDDEEVTSLDQLPSLGSALHASGNCRPCNFFGKGRCSNEAACDFCHMSHQKRKPTRQEKRERKAAWIARQQVDTLLPALSATAVSQLAKPSTSTPKAPQATAQQALAHCTPTIAPPVTCMFNFDDYSDFSDDDDEVEEREGTQWSREGLLGVKAAMMAR